LVVEGDVGMLEGAVVGVAVAAGLKVVTSMSQGHYEYKRMPFGLMESRER
jgi:hypothetical protein